MTRWRPVPSAGGAIGVGLWLAATLIVGTLVFAYASSQAVATRWAVLGLALPATLVWLVVAIGALRRLTLVYRLGPVALEIRSAADRLRVRYDQIERLTPAVLEARLPTLWPGAYFGCKHAAAGVVLWRATSRGAPGAVAVDGSGVSYILTPAESDAFGVALSQHLDAVSGAAGRPEARRCHWVDRVAGLDGWYRAGVVAGLGLAALGLAGDVARYAAARPALLTAVVALMINLAIGLLCALRWPALARLLVVSALLTEILVWWW